MGELLYHLAGATNKISQKYGKRGGGGGGGKILEEKEKIEDYERKIVAVEHGGRYGGDGDLHLHNHTDLRHMLTHTHTLRDSRGTH